MKNKPSSVRGPVLLGLFTGTAVGAGYLMSGIPNVELMSLVVALSGAVLGPRSGMFCGALAGTIFSLGNPYGPAPPVLLLAQVLGHGSMGFWGWFFGRRILARPVSRGILSNALPALVLAVVGTGGFEVLTNLAIVAMTPDASMLVVLGWGLPYSLIHLGVNVVIFSLLFPQLARRLGSAGDSTLVGRVPIWLLALAVGAGAMGPPSARAQSSPADSLAAIPDSLATLPHPPAGPHGWERELWNPFSSTTLRWLDKRTSWVVLTDGGLGSEALVLGEAGTSPVPLVLRDGVPVGTGHRLTDAPWLWPNQGAELKGQGQGRDPLGGTDGWLDLGNEDRMPGQAVSTFQGVKGPHETYQRGIDLLTPRTAWRLGFEFEESIDREGYNFTETPDDLFHSSAEFRGQSSLRRSRTRLIRNLDEHNRLSIEYSVARKTKDDLPVLGAQHLELWSDGAVATVQGLSGSLNWHSSCFWTNRTVQWGDRPVGVAPASDFRKIETGREGLFLAVRKVGEGPSDGSGLKIRITHWDIHDPGVSWSIPDQSASGDGASIYCVADTWLNWAVAHCNLGLTEDFRIAADSSPGAFLTLRAKGQEPAWRLNLEAGGRSPRSDELLTPLQLVVATRDLFLLPNTSLKHEKTLRANVFLQQKLLGFNLALDLAVRRLRQGITWVPDHGESSRGRWRNDLQMDSARLTASLSREGRFLGWGRARLEGTWQNFQEKSALAAFLPPEKYLRLELMWEQHLFQEDGIVQAALLNTYRGPMDDPWDVTRSVVLPAASSLDLLLGFRLVGANLSLNIRNLTDQRIRLSAGSLSPGREMDLRLKWTFLY